MVWKVSMESLNWTVNTAVRQPLHGECCESKRSSVIDNIMFLYLYKVIHVAESHFKITTSYGRTASIFRLATSVYPFS